MGEREKLKLTGGELPVMPPWLLLARLGIATGSVGDDMLLALVLCCLSLLALGPRGSWSTPSYIVACGQLAAEKL